MCPSNPWTANRFWCLLEIASWNHSNGMTMLICLTNIRTETFFHQFNIFSLTSLTNDFTTFLHVCQLFFQASAESEKKLFKQLKLVNLWICEWTCEWTCEPPDCAAEPNGRPSRTQLITRWLSCYRFWSESVPSNQQVTFEKFFFFFSTRRYLSGYYPVDSIQPNIQSHQLAYCVVRQMNSMNADGDLRSLWIKAILWKVWNSYYASEESISTTYHL